MRNGLSPAEMNRVFVVPLNASGPIRTDFLWLDNYLKVELVGVESGGIVRHRHVGKARQPSTFPSYGLSVNVRSSRLGVFTSTVPPDRLASSTFRKS